MRNYSFIYNRKKKKYVREIPVYVISAGPDTDNLETVSVVGSKEQAEKLKKYFESGTEWTFNRENKPLICNCALYEEFLVEMDNLSFFEQIIAKIAGIFENKNTLE